MDAFAERLAKFLTLIIDLDSRRPKPRFWAPSGFGKLGRKLLSRQEIDQRVAPLNSVGSSDMTDFDNMSVDESEDEDGVQDIKRARELSFSLLIYHLVLIIFREEPGRITSQDLHRSILLEARVRHSLAQIT